MSQPAEPQPFDVVLPEELLPKYPRAGRRFAVVREPESPAVDVLRPEPPPPSKAERERAAFYRLLPGLLATHAGRYVAVHDERAVDDDADDIALVRRVHARFGYVPIYVGLVAVVPPVVRMPRYREVLPPG